MKEYQEKKNSNQPKDVHRKYECKAELEKLIDEIGTKIHQFEEDLSSQKERKGEYQNAEKREEMLNSYRTKYELIDKTFRGEVLTKDDKEELVKAENNINTLESFFDSNENKETEREMYAEEKAKLEEWNQRVEEQDKDLDIVHENVQNIHRELQKTKELQKTIQKQAKGLNTHMDKTGKVIDVQNKQMKSLINKISNDKLCINIVLVLILLGLVCVLIKFLKK